MSELEKGCPFCNKFKQSDKDILWIGTTAVFTPLFPVVDGHKLIVPIEHVEDFGSDKDVSARTMKVAADIARTYEHVNLITSKGHYATQTVRHLHLHIVPREQGDGLYLPWTGQCKYGCKNAGEHYHQEEVAAPKEKEKQMDDDIGSKEWYKPSEIADRMLIVNTKGRKDYGLVLRLIKTGNLSAKNVGLGKTPYWLVHIKDIQRWNAEGRTND